MARKVLVPWPIPKAGVDALSRAGVDVLVIHGPRGEPLAEGQLIETVKGADLLLPRGGQRIRREVMTAGPRLRGIANYGVGYDNIDTKSATELGIPVTNTPGVLTDTTADLAWALLMATARMIPQAHSYTVSGQWQQDDWKRFMGLDIGPGGSKTRKVLGIVGFGRIGQAVMKRSRGFGMRVTAYDPYKRDAIENSRGVEYRELDELLKESDFVTLHCPLTEETRHLIGKRELHLMKSTAILINTSRGPVVDETALVAALEQGRIAGAGLDVYEDEPRLSSGLSELPNVVLLPHIGSATVDTREQMALLAAKNGLAMLRGRRPPNVVNPEVYESPAYNRRSKGRGASD
ncbi:MAG: D-glycerate dehydrogenase [Deltaproteobacteria bacterium]|nr:D-glycerate dehydrogenase [Deltaproteobacteria bacterium]